jgi:hypothetical protein
MVMLVMMTGVDNAAFLHKHVKKKRGINMLPLCPYVAPDVRIANYNSRPDKTLHALIKGGRALLSLQY